MPTTDLETSLEQLNEYVSSLPNDITTRIESGWDYIHKDIGDYNKHLVMDTVPKTGSTNPVTSDGIRKALDEIASEIDSSNLGDMPPQAGHAGKYLQTDGTHMFWSEVDALPAQSGHSGKFLTTDGTSASWDNIPIPSADGKTITVDTNGVLSAIIDSSLSSTSTNSVQNNVIYSALAGKANSSHTHTADQVTGTIPNPTKAFLDAYSGTNDYEDPTMYALSAIDAGEDLYQNVVDILGGGGS